METQALPAAPHALRNLLFWGGREAAVAPAAGRRATGPAAPLITGAYTAVFDAQSWYQYSKIMPPWVHATLAACQFPIFALLGALGSAAATELQNSIQHSVERDI